MKLWLGQPIQHGANRGGLYVLAVYNIPDNSLWDVRLGPDYRSPCIFQATTDEVDAVTRAWLKRLAPAFEAANVPV